MRKISVKNLQTKQNTFYDQLYIYIFFRKPCCLWDNVQKYCTAAQATDDNMGRARVACWITKATNTHSEYVTRVAFSSATTVARMSLDVMLYVHYLSFLCLGRAIAMAASTQTLRSLKKTQLFTDFPSICLSKYKIWELRSSGLLRDSSKYFSFKLIYFAAPWTLLHGAAIWQPPFPAAATPLNSIICRSVIPNFTQIGQ